MISNGPQEKARPQAGFAGLLDELSRSVTGTATLAEIARQILTLRRRQPYNIAVRSLTSRQSALLNLMGNTAPSLSPLAHAETGGSIWHIGFYHYGRILLTSQLPEGKDYSVLAWLAISEEISRKIDAKAREAEDADAVFDRELEAWLAGLSEKEKREVVEHVRDGVDHIDPVLIYVNDATFTNFGPYNTLLRKPGALFERLTEAKVKGWRADEKRFVGCFYWIRRAGMRGEEFNGIQLTPRILHQHFDSCFRLYSKILGPKPEAWPGSLNDKAGRLLGMRQEISGSHITGRWVNGLTFHKVERFITRESISQTMADFPADLQEYIENAYGLQASSFASASELLRQCVEIEAATSGEDTPSLMTGIERLQERITISAAENTQSDIGMTRGIRDLWKWQQALDEGRFVEICEWPTTDYFCGVFPSRGMMELMPDPVRLARVLTACSVRMQYNSWHYMPGHFAKELAPHHFYFPPRMPDTAIWSDQHHAGHVMAAVRHSIRSPAPLTYRDRTYFGMVDLRVFRTVGVRYTRKELCTAIKYTDYLRAVSQAISDIAASGGPRIAIRAFDKSWFDRYCSALFAKGRVLQHANAL